MTGPLLVTDFDTEENHDILTVNGKARSDHSISKRGWRLCPPPWPQQTMVTVEDRLATGRTATRPRP
eukprot:Skav224168  [mRNA]  locus=scaffold2007:340766:341782:+ [translate_table: standard]